MLNFPCSKGKGVIRHPIKRLAIYIYYVIKVSDPFFLENLVDFNEARLHEATLNLHTHARIFSRLSIASVDGKQNFSEIVFCALFGFSM